MLRIQRAVIGGVTLGIIIGLGNVVAAAPTVWFMLATDDDTLLVGETTDVTVSVMADPTRLAGDGVASCQFDLDIVPQPGSSPVTVAGAVTYLNDFAGYPLPPVINSEVDGEISIFGAGVPLMTTSSNAGIDGNYTEVARFTLEAIEVGTASYQLGIEGLFEAAVFDSGAPVISTPMWAQSQFVITVTPEPASAIVLMALSVLALRRRRK